MDENGKVKIQMAPNEPTVSILGSGNFGKSVAKRMAQCGVRVMVGSRHPGPLQNGIPTTSQEEALSGSIIIIAIPFNFYENLPLDRLPAGTILVDCSNRTQTCKPHEMSQAEKLEGLVGEGVAVVKAFNTLSAYQLENNIPANGQEIPLAGNEKWAKDAVAEIVGILGYRSIDYGKLFEARQIENITLSFFPHWRKPLQVSFFLWLFFYLVIFFRGQSCIGGQVQWSWNNMIVMIGKNINKTCDAHALTLLAACYLPGVLAAYIQLARGTKYSQFPGWLDRWLKMRKYLGLLMLFSASFHACLYLLKWKEQIETVYEYLFVNFGLLGFGLVVILAITSLPSVSSTLSWREFRAIQSWLGWFCLICCSLHCLFNGAEKNWKIFKPKCFWPGSNLLPILLPAVTFALKIPLVVPMVNWRLTKIRQGKVFKTPYWPPLVRACLAARTQSPQHQVLDESEV